MQNVWNMFHGYTVYHGNVTARSCGLSCESWSCYCSIMRTLRYMVYYLVEYAYIKHINTFIYSHRGKSKSTHSFIVHHGTDYRQLNSINIEKIGHYVLHDQVNLMEAVI